MVSVDVRSRLVAKSRSRLPVLRQLESASVASVMAWCERSLAREPSPTLERFVAHLGGVPSDCLILKKITIESCP